MSPRMRLALRGTALASCAALVGAGLFLATRDDDSGAARAGEEPALGVAFVPETPTATIYEVATAGPSAAAPSPSQVETTALAESAEVATSAPPPPPQPRPANTPAAPPPPVATKSAPIQDLPRFRDIQVLGFAADAVLPSGLTFRQCMELPPKREGWPAAVHLYYLGQGDWMVETHLSEVQVVFHEATDSFEVRNFQPVNPACR